MLFIKSTTTACILLVFFCAAWLSAARFYPPGGAEVNTISSTEASVATATMNKIKETKKQSFHGKRSLRTHNLSHEVDGGFVAFTTDYHPPRHHPPKNNK
ncbi:protein GOLVEN 5 [Lathyrus oleraceus]|uniref:Uncharacterized protein n=1 Tax=Pisum sativum TaxID=3888 RepID=A0A9D5AS11_PEA|nr:protein GOLVEN 5 [Pisum sativum]KAI5419528.1 hypothetical protein KIW84_043626 [Pisum sativum]